MHSRRRSLIVGGLAACVLVAAAGSAAGAPGGGKTRAHPRPDVYAGMTDEQIVAFDQRGAAEHVDKVAEYVAAHRADLESSLGSLRVVEPLVLLRSMGSSLPAVIDAAVAAVYGRVVSVRVETTGALVSRVVILDVGKHGATSLAAGDTIDLTQTAHVDLDQNDRPVLAASPELPALLPGRSGIYFLSQPGTTGGFAVTGLGSTLPVADGAIVSADAEVQSWAGGRSPAALMREIRKAARE